MSKMSDIPEHPIDYPSWEDSVAARSCSTAACETRELKPCPFCGESTDFLRTQVGEPESTAKDWGVQCCKCGAVVPPDGSARRAGVYWNVRKRNWVKCSERLPNPTKPEIVRPISGTLSYALIDPYYLVLSKDSLIPLVATFSASGWQVLYGAKSSITHWLDEAIELPEDV